MKEVNEKARLLASRLVTDLGYATQRCSGKTSEGIWWMEWVKGV